MTYTKPGWKPVTTELNDRRRQKTGDEQLAEVWDSIFPHGMPEPGTKIVFLHGEYDKMMHRDWCQDHTCWCHR